MYSEMPVIDHGGIAPIDIAVDPLLANQPFRYTQTFRVLGFCVRVTTNAEMLLIRLAESWTSASNCAEEPLSIRLGVTQGGSIAELAAPVLRADDHQLAIITDAANFIVCNLDRGSAFGWITQAVLEQHFYFQYSLLDAAAKCLISTSYATPMHAACVSYRERGFLLCGDSGAGKSTLAYACARAGWTYTSDDASYLLWRGSEPRVRGNAQMFRLRPSAVDLFPELAALKVTRRAEGKPSIEADTGKLSMVVAPEANIDCIVFLNRQNVDEAEVTRLTADDWKPYFKRSLFASGAIRNRQAEALHKLERLDTFSLAYSELASAIECLERLSRKY